MGSSTFRRSTVERSGKDFLVTPSNAKAFKADTVYIKSPTFKGLKIFGSVSLRIHRPPKTTRAYLLVRRQGKLYLKRGGSMLDAENLPKHMHVTRALVTSEHTIVSVKHVY